MRRIYVLLGITTLLAAAVLSAQSDSDYQGYMKIVGPTSASMQKNIAAKDAGATGADAKKLQDTFKMVEAFWQARGAADAVNFAKNAQNVTGMVAKDAAAGDMDKAAMDAKGLGANCGGCHMAHREKTDAGFKIK
jgi:cytochrome c556